LDLAVFGARAAVALVAVPRPGPAAARGLGLGLLVAGALVGGALLGVLVAVAAAAAAAATVPAPAGRRLGLLLLGARGGRLLPALLDEDGVDEIGLAQPAEAVHAELVGDQVQVGQRALLQRGAVQYGSHAGPLDSVGRRPAALCAAVGNPSRSG